MKYARTTSTVFQAEIIGIKLACEEMVKMYADKPFKYVKIFSDSQAAIDSSEVTSQAVLDTKVALNSLAKLTRNTVLVWIKAHVGHEGNEVADEMAKQGTTSNNNTTKRVIVFLLEVVQARYILSLIHI